MEGFFWGGIGLRGRGGSGVVIVLSRISRFSIVLCIGVVLIWGVSVGIGFRLFGRGVFWVFRRR